MKVLVVVDMQKDFIDGVLGTNEAKEIVPEVVERVKEAKADPNWKVIFTRDTHKEDYMNTQEGKNLPVPHCIEGTEGHELYGELKELAKDSTIINKPSFGSLELPLAIKRQIGMPETIELLGVCTDICVISNALILKAIFPEVSMKIQERLCAGVTKESHKSALEILGKSCQVQIIEKKKSLKKDKEISGGER